MDHSGTLGGLVIGGDADVSIGADEVVVAFEGLQDGGLVRFEHAGALQVS